MKTNRLLGVIALLVVYGCFFASGHKAEAGSSAMESGVELTDELARQLAADLDSPNSDFAQLKLKDLFPFYEGWLPSPILGSGRAATGGSSAGGKSADEVARELANPNSDLAQLKFKNQFYFYDGDLPKADDQWNYMLLFQPIFPFSLGETASGAKRTMFIRPAIPFTLRSPYLGTGGWGDETGLGDIGFDWAVGTSEKSGWLTAFGVVGTLPTATNERLGSGKLSLGPEYLIAHMGKEGVFGAFATHQWDIGGWGDQYVNKSSIQPIAMFLPGGGWSVGTSGTISYNWRTTEWTVPLDLTIGRTVKMGNTPVKIDLQVEYFVDQPDAFGPKWMIGLNFTPVVENFIEKWIKGL